MSSKQSPPPKAHANTMIKALREAGNLWRTSNQIHEYLGGISLSTRYNLISSSNTYGVLERRSGVGGTDYEYRLTETYAKEGAEYVGQRALKAKVDAAPAPKVRTNTRWDKDERAAIEREVRLIRKTNPMPLTLAVNVAQQHLIDRNELLPARRRHVTQINHVKWLHEALQRKESAPPEAPVQAAKPPTEAPRDAAQTNHANASASATAAVIPPPKTGALIELLLTRTQQAATKILSDAIDYGVTRAFKSIVDSAQGQKVLAALQTAPAALIPKHDPVAPSEDRDRKPRILIAGVRGPEVGEIHEEFTEVFDLRFWLEGESHQRLKDMSKSADSTIVMVKRLGHSEADIVKASGKPYKFAPGNNPVVATKEMLTALYSMS